MAAEFIIAPEAEQDIAEAYAWYESRRIGLGEEFLSCVEACLERSAVHPRCMPMSTRLSPRIGTPLSVCSVLRVC